MSTSREDGCLGRRRAEDLPGRRWLQIAAASAGMSAALIGWSLVGSEIGVAGADRGAGSSSSAGPAASSSKGVGTAKSRANAGARSTVTPRPNRVAVQNALAPKTVIAANRTDPFGALGKFLTGSLKELLNRKTTLNPLQRLDDLSPKTKSLLDLIPKIPVRTQDSLWNREVQAREAERQQRADANKQRIAEIIRTGVQLTASDGTPVYTVDGKVFVQYRVMSWVGGVPGPPQPTLFTLSDRISQRNRDAQIRTWLKLDPAQVRSLQK
jgi:Skp family chaperone for outer membrane proteins